MEDNRAASQWDKSEISYQNYVGYLAAKPNKFKLTIVDLFYIKNFKGGSATTNEPESQLETKFNAYSALLEEINFKFKNKKLSELSELQLSEIIEIGKKAFELVNPEKETKIDGFSVSFLTTLLHFYFPNLFPILDRRVLNGLCLLDETDLNSQKQVKNIQSFYPTLIREFKNRTKDKSIRQLDRQLFIQKIQSP